MTGSEAKAIFSGCYVATLTSFDATDHLDEGAARDHVHWLVENGVDGLCPAGTTGEFLYLTEDEKRRLTALTVEAAAGRVPVLAGVWALRAPERVDLAHAAEDAGASGVFLPPPIYYPADDATLFDYYSAVHAATNLPVFAYNIPQYAANSLSSDTVGRMLEAGIVAGIKDSTGSAERVGELVNRFGSTAVIFAASDSFATRGRELGADGFISAIANVMPAEFARLWRGEAALQPVVDSVRAALKQVGSIPALKTLLARRGFGTNAFRLPASPLTPAQVERLTSLLPE
jgi:4-hydroxy-tetrahydrodipicolinate synthase